jgi:hypothetical protein
MDPDAFATLLPSLCSRETAAAGGKGWTLENPLFGHCAVVSLLAQDLFDGELMRISLEGTPFAESRSHYFNRLPDGTVRDFTLAQFQGGLPTRMYPMEARPRDYIMNGADTRERYERLKKRLEEAMRS